jgi:hypothetical protein
MHLPIQSSPDELKSMVAKVKEAGINLYGCGVIYMKTEDEVDKAFEYAKNAGFTMIIGVHSYLLLKMTGQKVKETNLISLNKACIYLLRADYLSQNSHNKQQFGSYLH